MTLGTEPFVSLAKATAQSLGFPDLPLVVLPHPFETLSQEEVRRLCDERFDEVLSKVIAPKGR